MVEVERIPEETASQSPPVTKRELDGLDLFDPDCPIEHVITVEALKEGWDCSFAYVFCSVSRIQERAGRGTATRPRPADALSRKRRSGTRL